MSAPSSLKAATRCGQRRVTPRSAGAARISTNPTVPRRCWPKRDSPTQQIGRMTIGRICSGRYHGRSLVALPPQPEWNDLECMWLRRVSAPVWADNVAEAFAFLHAEGGASFNLTLHPWIAGQAHRIRWLREALSRVLGRGGIWQTTTDEVARVAREQL